MKDNNSNSDNDIVVGLTEAVRQSLLSHCDIEMRMLEARGYKYSMRYQEHRIFKELLQRVPRELMDKGSEPGYLPYGG